MGGELGRKLPSYRDFRGVPLESRRNPLSHILTRAVGVQYRVNADWRLIDLQAGDRCLLCSDGVHDMLEDARIGAALAASDDPVDAVTRLAGEVMKSGAGDNFTMLCVYARRKRLLSHGGQERRETS